MSKKAKKKLVDELSNVYTNYLYDIDKIEYRVYQYKQNSKCEQEMIIITFEGGGTCIGNNNCNSISATARLVAKMLDGEASTDQYFRDIMVSDKWERIL